MTNSRSGLAVVAASIIVCAWLVSAATASPTRIVSLIPAVTEMLFAIGAGRQVIAVSSFDRYPPEVSSLPRVGGLLDPDTERILSLKPDLVIVYGTQTDLRRQLERAGIAMFSYNHGSLPDVMRTIRDLGTRVGRGEQAEKLAAGLEADLASIRQRVAGRDRPKTLLVFGREPRVLRGMFASGGVGFLNDMLDVAGASNVFADVKRESVQATTELVLARAPQVILELRPDVAREKMDAERAVWNALAVPAVRARRVHILTDPALVVPGPRVEHATELIARAVHPEVFRGAAGDKEDHAPAHLVELWQRQRMDASRTAPAGPDLRRGVANDRQ
jgi:cobalamin transport system substrate-binding protein